MSGHTPGPLSVHGPYGMGEEAYFEIVTPTMTALATVHALDEDGTEAGDAEANALLYAAAPELLAALKPLVHRTKAGNAVFLALTEANAEAALAAIAKAEGR